METLIKALGTLIDAQDNLILGNSDVTLGIDLSKEYPYIGMSSESVINNIIAIEPFLKKTTKHVTFIDLGSGTGNILSIAGVLIPKMLEGCFTRLIGVEKNAQIINARTEMFKKMFLNVEMVKGDLLKIKRFPKGSKANDKHSQTIVWFYRPFREEDIQENFQERVFDYYPKGTIFISPMHIFNAPEKFQKIRDFNIYKK